MDLMHVSQHAALLQNKEFSHSKTLVQEPQLYKHLQFCCGYAKMKNNNQTFTEFKFSNLSYFYFSYLLFSYIFQAQVCFLFLQIHNFSKNKTGFANVGV